MTPEDLDVIRQRNEERKRAIPGLEDFQLDWSRTVSGAAAKDIDALLAEVERLQHVAGRRITTGAFMEDLNRLWRLRDENDRLQARVQELLEANTREVERRREAERELQRRNFLSMRTD